MSAAVAVVGDLTDEHIGWQIRVTDRNPLIAHRTFVLAGLRTWTYQGVTTVGLVDPTNARGRIVGDERHYHPDTPCELLRQVKKTRCRAVAR